MTDEKSEKEKAFAELVHAHADKLRGFGLHLTRNPADANDLVQETLLKAYRFWDKFDQGTNLRAWLFRIMKNSYINIYRKQARVPCTVEYSETMKPLQLPDWNSDGNNRDGHVFGNLLGDDLSGAISGLPPNYRTVVILSDIEGLQYEEIAQFIACPIGTVRSRLHRGRRLLRSKLYDYARESGYISSAEDPA
jgi:RNA polymerase sigma-70 factor, ECF subfamily